MERRFAWLARHAALFQDNRLAFAALSGPFQLDELESFEANRYQPVTVPILIERRTLFIVATSVGPLRRKGRMTPLQRRPRSPPRPPSVPVPSRGPSGSALSHLVRVQEA